MRTRSVRDCVSLELRNPAVGRACPEASTAKPIQERKDTSLTTNSSAVNVLRPRLGQFPDHSCLLFRVNPNHARVQCFAYAVHALEDGVGYGFLAGERTSSAFIERSARGTAARCVVGVQSSRKREEVVIHDNRWVLRRQGDTRYLELGRRDRNRSSAFPENGE